MGFGGSSSSGNNASSSVQSVWGGQARHLRQMFRQASRASDPRAAQQAAMTFSNQMMPQFQQGLSGLLGMADPSASIAAQSASLQEGLGNLWENTILPGIDRTSAAVGGFGGGRQGVAQGVGAGELASAFTQGLGDITQRANQTALGALSAMPGYMQYGQELSQMPYTSAFGPLSSLAAILGGPTTLGRSVSWGQNSSSGFDIGGFDFGG